ncbi:hypothetical protein [Haloarcula litorea]|uniref:hypothetical protein n=1 Tax=Haloarcula litorea TaxID=3032579 RepID=UPI0023E8E67D|nr:hypothetical protein [Halomicroarcula sp. GDY20]
MSLSSTQILVAAAVVVTGAVAVGATTTQLGSSPAADEPVAADGTSDASETALVVDSTLHRETVRSTDGLGVDVTLSSEGDEAVDRSVSMLFDEDGDGVYETTVAERAVTVPAEGQTTVSFDVAGDAVSPGTLGFSVVTEANRTLTTGTVRVLRPPELSLSAERRSVTTLAGRNATLSLSATNDGDYAGTEPLTVRFAGPGAENDTVDRVTVSAGETRSVEATLPTATLDPGTYDYRLTLGNATTTGTVTVQQPATFRVADVDAEPDVVRGTAATTNVSVRNTGDVSSSAVVTYAGPTTTVNRTVELGGNETTRLTYRTNTTSLARGNYTRRVDTPDDGANATLRVRDSEFVVRNLRGVETISIGEPMVFRATVKNTGDANGTERVELWMDLDGDDRPEPHGIGERVSLAPGETRTVVFEPDYTDDSNPLNRDLETKFVPFELGTFVYGVYTDDSNQTGVFVVEQRNADGGADGASDDGGSDDGTTGATLDEITVEKYGIYYERLSAETRRQIDEIHARQPFADGLVITEVRTREEIARQKYGLDVKRGDKFDFHGLPMEYQQRIEADFDAQFQSDRGDRVESYDEIARAEYGTEYENLSAARQAAVEEAYDEQFD